MSDDLTLVYGGMLESAVGSGHGLAAGALDAVAGEVRAGHAALLRKRESGEVGFFDAPEDRAHLPAILETAERFREEYDHLLVLGIGGSALGITALVSALTPAFGTIPGALDVRCLDNVDPVWVGEALDAFPLERTAFAVISKSGSTPETLSQYLVVRDRLVREFGDDWAKRVVFITDPAKGPLRADVDRTGAVSFPIPGNVGGRFSVLTPVGAFPVACAGIDVPAFLDGTARARDRCATDDLMANPGYLLGTLLVLADRDLGLRNHVLMPYSQRLRETAFWFRQLWAESLGKSESVGPTPIAALGATDQHSQMQLYMEGPRDKVVIFLEVGDHGREVPVPATAPEGLAHLGGGGLGELLHAELLGSRAALIDAGRPVLTARLPVVDEARLGGLMMTFMVATAMAGELLGINAYDQPGVELGKVNAAALLGKAGLESEAARLREAAEEIEKHRI